MNRQTGNQNRNKNGKTWSSPIITVIYVVGVTLAVGGYVFTDVTKMLIPGLSPLALAAVTGAIALDRVLVYPVLLLLRFGRTPSRESPRKRSTAPF